MHDFNQRWPSEDAHMALFNPAQIPYLIVLAAAIVVAIVVLTFRRYRKPVDKADD